MKGGTKFELGVAAAAAALVLALGSFGFAGAGVADERPAAAQDVVTVAADGSGDHTSIQEAIDAAPEGAIVRIGPGVYEEKITISKALALEGAGWETTLIASPAKDPAKVLEDREVRRAFQERWEAAKTPEEELREKVRQAVERLRG